MPIFNHNKIPIESAVRFAWLVTALLLLFFVLVPYIMSSYLASQGVDQFDSRLNFLALLTIAGSLSSLSFFIIAYRFNRKRTAPSASPNKMWTAIIKGLFFVLIYWALFFYLTVTHEDGDGIMRGWMGILFPFILVKMVLHFSRDSK